MLSQSPEQRYWRANFRLITILLSIWAFVSIGCGILFVEALNTISIGNLPFGFWMAQQGSIYTFVILIFTYAVLMDRADKRYHDEREALSQVAAAQPDETPKAGGEGANQ